MYISYLCSYCKQQINYLLCQLADRRPTRQSQSPPNLRILKLTQQLTKQLNNIRSSRQLSCLDLRKQLMSQFNKEDINQGGKWTLQKRKGDQTREADIKKQKWTWTEDLHNDYKYILNLLNWLYWMQCCHCGVLYHQNNQKHQCQSWANQKFQTLPNIFRCK